MIGIYHYKDFDGIASGAIMKKAFPKIKLIGYHYNEPLTLPEENQMVYMADVSLPMEKMAEIARYSRHKFTWIDHHKTAIDAYNRFVSGPEMTPAFEAVTKVGVGACKLCWQYFFPGTRVPEGVELLSTYDVWDQKDPVHWESRVLPFQYGLRSLCGSVEDLPGFVLEDGPGVAAKINEVIREGKIVLRYMRMSNKRYTHDYGFEADVFGYRAICKNGGDFNSNAFKGNYDPDRHDIMLAFVYTHPNWYFSIYTEKDIDVGEIARRMGGGGHKKAAGFDLDDISKMAWKISKTIRK